jgi:hypothetical protein
MRLLLVAAAALVVVLPACGGSSSEPAAPAGPAALLAAAIANADQESSYRSSFRMRSDLGGTLVEVSGTTRSSADSTRMRGPVEYAENGEAPIAFELIALDDEAFMRGDVLAGALPPGKEWMRVQDETMAQQSLTPRQFVDLLRDSPDVEEAGRETIRGRPTVLLRGELDMAEVAERIGGGPVADALRRSPERADAFHVVVEVWIGEEDEQLERVSLDMRVDGQQGSLHVTGDILERGVSLDDVQAPPARLVVDERELRG